ncbi:CRISPR-associated endonuclease Cas1 [uncultured Thalassospira sp.]|uniref:CRISPR-associated endonuclease Cas1 n=1 Tax=uncultured Thalassospira sp. TaxID=404382 RepID=UPI0030D86034|tara:strand:+ start:2696 stop:4690 length:1995 start_codon:yes stop_codon:yes gene_type:complete
MPEDLFAALVATDNLAAAWEKVRHNGGCAGGDGETIAEFQRRGASRLGALAAKLRDGDYRPGELRLLQVPQKNGEMRPLAIPPVEDRIAQTACAQILSPILDPQFEDGSFAYRPGRSVMMAVRAVEKWRKRGFTHVVEADIVRCFERIAHQPLLARLEQGLGPRPGAGPLVDLVGVWLEHAGLAFQTPGIGLPQGAPLSPLLANLYLDMFDDALDAKGIAFVRFADDFVLLCRNEAAARQALAHSGAVLGRYGLELQSDKTGIVDFDRSFAFLGHLFVRSMILKQVGDPQEDPVSVMQDVAAADLQASLDMQQQKEAEAEERASGYDRGQRVLYVTEPGRRLGLRNMSFTVKTAQEDRELLAISHQRVDRIDLGPDARVDSDVIRHALATDTGISFMNGHGETQGWLYRPHHDRAALHLAQAAIVLDPARAFALARCIVRARLHNQRAQLHRLNRQAKDADVIVAARDMGRMIRKLPVNGTVASLRGHEGAAAARYWPALGRLCAHATQPFHRQRPARDPLNATINYLTAMLTRDVRAAILAGGLHPGFGVLHVSTDGHEACVWDVMEGFRAPLTEGLAVALFNQGRLKPEMFSNRDDGTCHIRREAVRAIIRGYETAAARLVKSPRSDRKLTWRSLMAEEARAYGKHCLSPADTAFAPYHMDF